MCSFKLNEYFHTYENDAKYMMGSSDPESLTMEEVFDTAWAITDNSYQLGDGLFELRDGISGLYDTLRADNIAIFNGAEEAIYIIMRSLLKSGDEIVVHYPCFQSIFSVAEDIGCEVIKCRIEQEREWKLDLDYIESQIAFRTRLLVVNFPHNPTGAYLTAEEMAAIVDLCKRHQIYLLSDEVYRFLTADDSVDCQSFADRYEKAIALGGFSKTFAAPGLRIGWAASKDKAVLKQLVL